MPKVIMVQGTMSNSGKSTLAAGLCRVFYKDGYKVSPFKSQNMSSNAFVTTDGLIMSKAQAIQAVACKTRPSPYMNPILLKPVTDMGAEVIVNGESRSMMKASDYYAYKQKLVPEIMRAYDELAKNSDIIVVEGAGSPAEINLRENDIVNMGLAKMLNAPVILVGDIDMGGVFAQLFGTIALLEAEEQERIKALVINKFRGDRRLLNPGLELLIKKCQKPVAGVLSYLDIDIENEDSLSDRLNKKDKHDNYNDEDYLEKQLDILEAEIRNNLDLKLIYNILNEDA